MPPSNTTTPSLSPGRYESAFFTGREALSRHGSGARRDRRGHHLAGARSDLTPSHHGVGARGARGVQQVLVGVAGERGQRDTPGGINLPANPPPPPSTPFECVFERSLEADESGQPSTIRDVVRGALDASLAGSVTLPDSVPGSTVEVRFLSGSGAIKELATTQVPGAAGAAIQLDLSAAQVAAIAAPEPRPPAIPSYVRRDARLVPIGDAIVDFSALSLVVAPVTVGGGAWVQRGLDKLFKLPAPATTAQPFSGVLPVALADLSWTPTHLAVDGQFTAYFEQANRDAWLWWLTGPVGAVGVVLDDLRKEPTGLIPIALPPPQGTGPAGGPADGGGRTVPVAETEREVADNPGIYTEDPGAFCKPFSNPERVLGERSFSVIYRAEQPVVSPEATVRTVTGPLLDFELPAGLREAVMAGDEPRRRSLIGRATAALRGDSTAAASSAAAIRTPALEAFVTHDVLPRGLLDELQRGDRGRRVVDALHPVQWDSDASRYQAVTVARGHILEFRLRWRSNGYSLGTVAKTLTLAARQVKRIQKIEWRRLERARREERTQIVDSVADAVTRERQYDYSVEATLAEWARGESESSTAAAAGGFGFVTGNFIIGGGGGGSNASSSSSQEGGRRTTASEEQRLRDSIRRYGDSLRRLDSVVVNEVTQEETVIGTSEIVRNPNFGHALTIIYYQILRHLKVETAFAGVRECLFVPFAIKPFTVARAFRWRDLLRRGLLDRRFEQALRYLKDVLTGFAGSDVPPGRRSDQRIRHVSGSLFLTMAVARPGDTNEGEFDAAAWAVLNPFLGFPAAGIFTQLRALAEARRERQFQEEHAPGIAAAWVNTMRVFAGGTLLDADLTLASRYQFNGTVRVDFSASVGGVLTREMLASMRVVATRDLPPNSVANLTRLTVSYQTDQFQRTFAASSGAGDLVSPQTGVRDPGATVFALPDTWDRQDVRAEMVRAVNDLVGHLNEHAEHYHKVIWWNMDRDRIFMLVDGFEVPGANGISIASVIERDPIAIIGNSLVFRVSAGSFLGLGDIVTPAQLYNYYATHQPIADPMLISLPTDGLYAQTIMDECEALEEHFGNTDWVLSDKEPELADIDAALLATRRAEPQPTTPSAFPQTLINLQNAPEAPEPAGLADVLKAVTNPNAFRDMAGLAATQANAAAALQAAAGLATSFGAQAAALKLAQMAKAAQSTKSADQRLATIQRAVGKQLVTPEEARDHAGKVLEELYAPTPEPPHQHPQFENALDAAAGMPGSTLEAATPDGQVRVILASTATTPLAQQCGFPDIGGRLLSEGEVRAQVVSAAEVEHDFFWVTPGTGAMLQEGDDSQFEHLVRYWLEVRGTIGLDSMGAIATALGDTTQTPAAKFLRLLSLVGELQANIDADVATVAANLIAAVPNPATPPNLQTLVEQALRLARASRLGQYLPANQGRPWSAVFVNTCIREAERNLNMEQPTGAAEALLGLSPRGRHWEYVREAHRRRFGCRRADGTFDPSCRRDGTFHAFEPGERPIQSGDIIVQDRRAKRTDTPANIWRFRDSQTNQGEMHGDIVVEVDLSATPPFAETIGGNVGNSAMRRRFPLNADGTLIVARAHNFRQQANNGTIAALPSAGSATSNLDSLSTRRIFAVLSPVQQCIPLERGEDVASGGFRAAAFGQQPG